MAKKRRLTPLEKRFYKKHPKSTVAPATKLVLEAKGRKRKASKPTDRVTAILHRYSKGEVKPTAGVMQMFTKLGLVGDSGSITAKGEKLLASYRRRKIANPRAVMVRAHNKRWRRGYKG